MDVVFYFDLACPFAYIGSIRAEHVIRSASPDSKLIWRPVLLGALYRQTDAPQGTQSASVVMAPARLRVAANDLRREAERVGLKPPANPSHPQRTYNALRWILATPIEFRKRLIELLYHEYWQLGGKLTEVGDLEHILAKMPVGPAKDAYTSSLGKIGTEEIKKQLEANTSEAAGRGAFGVPSFWVHPRGREGEGKLWWGQDRLHFVALNLGAPRTANCTKLPAVILRSLRNTYKRPLVRMFHDVASPFAYLGVTQAKRICAEANADLEFVPIVLGALFNQIGTPLVPGARLAPAKRDYLRNEMQDWAKYWGVTLKFTPHFPLKTLRALRLCIAYPELTLQLHQAAWLRERDVNEDSVLEDEVAKWISSEGRSLTVNEVMAKADSPEIKARLRSNTSDALALGCCGVPSFQIVHADGTRQGPVFGQDRWNIVVDMARGWRSAVDIMPSSL